MNPSTLSPESQEALRRAMGYWVENWDWECPILFGIELDELKEVLAYWPVIKPGTEEAVALASNGAMRELLLGGSTIDPAEVPATIGLSYEQAEALCSEVSGLAKAFFKE